MKSYPSDGHLRYSRTDDGGYKLIVEVHPTITAFYRTLVPRAIRLNMQRYPPHISVVRKEIPVNLDAWGKYEGEVVDFEYGSDIMHDDTYYWLNVYSPRLHEIRVELGLPPSSEWSRPPDGADCFHSTIGNVKPLR